MVMGRYDPEPDKPYAVCSTCGEVHHTREDMNAHHRATTPEGGGTSHSASIQNRTREERIRDAVEWMADSAMTDLLDEIYGLINQDGITEEEVTEATKQVWMDLSDAWTEYLADE
jgi:hypothetical protein